MFFSSNNWTSTWFWEFHRKRPGLWALSWNIITIDFNVALLYYYDQLSAFRCMMLYSILLLFSSSHIYYCNHWFTGWLCSLFRRWCPRHRWKGCRFVDQNIVKFWNGKVKWYKLQFINGSEFQFQKKRLVALRGFFLLGPLSNIELKA